MHWLIRVGDIEHRDWSTGETGDLQFVSGAAGKDQAISVGNVGMGIGDPDGLQQAGIVFAALSREGNGVVSLL